MSLDSVIEKSLYEFLSNNSVVFKIMQDDILVEYKYDSNYKILYLNPVFPDQKYKEFIIEMFYEHYFLSQDIFKTHTEIQRLAQEICEKKPIYIKSIFDSVGLNEYAIL